MKTKTKDSIVLAVLFLLLCVLGFSISYIGIPEKDPFKIWFFPVFAVLVFPWFFYEDFQSFYYKWKNKRRKALEATGVLSFISAVSYEEEMMKIITQNPSPKVIDQKLGQLVDSERGKVKDVHGVVCGEQISGVVEGMHLTVTVTKPETAKAFRMIPRYLLKYVTVIDLSA